MTQLAAGRGRYSLAELAAYLGGELQGDGAVEISGLATLETAVEGQASFLANPLYHQALADTGASLVVLHPDSLAECPTHAILLDNPYLGFARLSLLFDDRPQLEAGVHPSAVVGDRVSLADGIAIGPRCVVGDGVSIGAGSTLAAGCTIGPDTQIGADCYIHPNVTIAHRVVMGDRVCVQSGAVLGSDGFGYAPHDEGWQRIAQIGSLRIGNDVQIGANTTIDRGALGDTVIEQGVILDNQIQIAHNVQIGAYTAMAGCAGVAGSSRIGSHCTIGGGVGIAGHLNIADHVHIAGMTLVAGDIREAGAYASGTALQPMDQWRKSAVRFRQLEDIAKRLRMLERILDQEQ